MTLIRQQICRLIRVLSVCMFLKDTFILRCISFYYYVFCPLNVMSSIMKRSAIWQKFSLRRTNAFSKLCEASATYSKASHNRRIINNITTVTWCAPLCLILWMFPNIQTTWLEHLVWPCDLEHPFSMIQCIKSGYCRNMMYMYLPPCSHSSS